MPRMRTIEQAYHYVKECDPATALTHHALRQMVINGIVPSCRVGIKYLVDLDTIDCCFINEPVQRQKPVESGTIRAVKV